MQNKRIFTAVLTALLLVGFIATSLISYFVAKDSIVSHLEEQMLPLTSDNIYSEIQRDLLQPVLISSLMANDTFVVEWAEAGEDPARMSSYLNQIRRKYNSITAFYVSDTSLRYYHPDGVIKTLNPEDPADAWYFRVRQQNNDYEINIDQDTADRSRLSIFVNYRVLDNNGKFIGVTGIGLSVTSVAGLIENYQKRYGRQIFFVDREGQVTLHGSAFNDEVYLQNKAGLDRLFTRILTSPSASVTYDAKGGDTIYLNSRLVPEFDWFLIVEQINDPASQRVEAALIVNVLISIGISLLVLLTVYFTLGGYQRRLEDMASRDKLTGAASRQVFDGIFGRAVKSAERKNVPLSLLTMDIDNFKEINDTYGHQHGDQVLRTFARIIRQQVRDADTLCRWGGEEFLLLLESCDLARAVKIAEGIRNAVKAHSFTFGTDTKILTLSLGVAEHKPDETQEALIERCDQALYRSKREGRDRVSAV